MKRIYLSIMLLFVGAIAFAQNGNISGTVISEDGEASIGAIVRLAETSLGTITDYNGDFNITDVPAGNYNLTVSSVGFEDYLQPISVVAGQTTNLGALTLAGGALELEGVEIIADIAVDRKTPVAISNISGEEIAEKTGNQELTMVMAATPSVYAAQGSGGYGDSRLTIRGFDDNNVVVMVNGVPVNDMENGSLYWSNWTGLQDVASKIQIQRGLGASMLSVPSIGGTVNIISKATDQQKGGWASATIGNDMFRKYAVQLSTGNMNGWAITAAGSKTTGDGYVDANFIDAYSWFGSITKDWDKHSLSLIGFGAPQKHGQGYNRTLSTFVAGDGSDYEQYLNSHKAHDFNSKAALRDRATGSANSIRYNSGWGYTTQEINGGYNQDGIFNQYSNFYHKPQVSLNHYFDISDKVQLTSNVYGSWGRGGGASSWGGPNRRVPSTSNFLSPFSYQESNENFKGGPIDWDAVYAQNVLRNPSGIATNTDGGTGDYYFFRASMNHHDYYGLMSKAIVDLNDELTLTGGFDGRTYSADHVRKVIDMFGLQGYAHQDFDYSPAGNIAVADDSTFGYSGESLFNRNNTGKVKWAGLFSELEYSKDKLTAALGVSGSSKMYKKIQHITGKEGESDWYDFFGGAVKGGVNYNVSDAVNVYGNAGYLSIQPIFDNVFQGGNNGGVGELNVFDDAANEKVLAFEAGAGYATSQFAANLNLYRTSWQDKAITVEGEDTSTGEPIYGNAFGVDALHQGIELDLRAQPVDNLDLTGTVSLGDWTWQNNTEYTLFDQQGVSVNDGGLYIEDVKVGNSPQTMIGAGANYKAPFGLGFYADYKHHMDYYAGFDAEDRDNPDLAGINSNKLPDFGLTNAGVSYDFDINRANKLRFDFNMNNLFDILYVNTAREGINDDGTYQDLSSLTGNFGLGRTWNSGLRLMFGETKPQAAKETIIMPAPAVETVVLDADGDGVIDASDMCPNTAGTVSGCPDTDGDGVIDSKDNCPEEAGTDKGCPVVIETPEVITETVTVKETVEVIPDADGDGVIDSKDKCPNVAGSLYNGGCPKPVVTTPAPVVTTPVVTRPTVQVVEQLNFIARSVLFNTNSDVIKTESSSKLNEIASIMAQYPNADFVIEGHTDSQGDAAYNKTLSQKRANSVKNYLINKGVSSSRLTAIGYGEELPIADNNTAAGRQQNRRVVIKLK